MSNQSETNADLPAPRPKGKGGAPLGNKNASTRYRNRPVAKAMEEAVMHAERQPNCKHKLGLIVRKVLALAAAGDLEAAKLVFDRLDGKALQSLDITHNQGPTLLHAQQARELASTFLEAQRVNDANEARVIAGEVIDKARDP